MVNIDQINIENLSLDELRKLKERITAAEQVPVGKRIVTLASMFKASYLAIKEFEAERAKEGDGTPILGEAFSSIAIQAFPKEANIGKRYSLSQTEVDNAKKKGEDAVAKA